MVTVGEIYEGFHRGPHLARHEPSFARWLDSVDVLIVDRATAMRYGTLRAYLRHDGADIGPSDIWIAATALQHDLTLVTRNLRHFGRLPGLTLLPPA